MNTIWTIAKREYDNYFNSPLAYVVMLAMLLPLGIFFAVILYVSAQNAFFGGGAAPDTSQINWLIVFLMVLPRVSDSLHPGNGGNPGFNKYDLDSNMRMVFSARST